jgi:translation initiation factor IF-2
MPRAKATTTTKKTTTKTTKSTKVPKTTKAVKTTKTAKPKVIKTVKKIEVVKSEPVVHNIEEGLQRPPIVAVMGHVDHGKTTLLDTIRDANVAAGEAGGITQNTRAHQITYNNQKLTFIDTPGHEAFSDMRSRGARITDFVLLVVAADDGVSDQTKESIKFAKESKTPIIVAVNKIDLPGANVDKIKNELAQNEVLVEEYGGDVQLYPVSALKKEGIKELLEGIILQAQIMEIAKTEIPGGIGHAVVLESRLDNKLGPIALVIMKSGNISVGQHAVSSKGTHSIRSILNEFQKPLLKAEEGDPVWIVGLNEVVETGNALTFFKTDDEAKKWFKLNMGKVEEVVFADEIAQTAPVEEGEVDELSLLASMLATKQKNDAIKKLNLVVKTDTQGTLEAVVKELQKLNTEEVEINILSKGTGAITRKDIVTAKAASGIVVGFQVEIPTDLEQIVKYEKVIVRTYKIIYELVDEIGDALEGLLEPEEEEEEIARAKVKQVFTLTNGQKVAGCEVTKGIVIKGYRVWVERGGEYEVGRGKITSLKQNKNEVKEVKKGIDCGILIEPQSEVANMEEGDEIVLYKIVKN